MALYLVAVPSPGPHTTRRNSAPTRVASMNGWPCPTWSPCDHLVLSLDSQCRDGEGEEEEVVPQ